MAEHEEGGKPEAQERDIQSVKRALDILEAVASAGEIGVTEIAHAVGLHVATTHNLLRTLARYHYLENRGGRYRIGASVQALAGQSDPLQGLPELVKPWLERISQETGEAASSSVLSGDVLRIVAFQAGTQAITIHFPQWVWPQPLCLATGRVLVADLPQTRWEEFIRDGEQAVPGRTAQEWREELEMTRARGYSALQHTDHGGQTALAFPVRSRSGRLLTAIGASAPRFRTTPELCARMFVGIQKVALELSEQLGCPAADLERIRHAAQPDWKRLLR